MKRIDTSGWKDFEIGELFVIKKGKRLTKADMREGTIRFIGSSSVNNGITAHISNEDHLNKPNTITVCYNGSVGETFYQEEVFWASDDVNVLYPKFKMNRLIAMYLLPIIKKTGKKYAFTDKWKRELMTKETIKLPVTVDGTPDWLYVESFMSKIETRVQSVLTGLKQIIDG